VEFLIAVTPLFTTGYRNSLPTLIFFNLAFLLSKDFAFNLFLKNAEIA